MRETMSASLWIFLVICVSSTTANDSDTDCHVRCPSGRVCVVTGENNHLHLCLTPAALRIFRGQQLGTRGSQPQSEGGFGEGGIDVEGRGQSSCPRPPVPPSPCVVQCVYDSDCQENQACCSTGCGQVCLFLEPGAISKPGSCPLLARRRDAEPCGARCQGDGECPGHLKCCRSRCGTTCQVPCFHWLGNRGLSNPWRLSHRCSFQTNGVAGEQ